MLPAGRLEDGGLLTTGAGKRGHRVPVNPSGSAFRMESSKEGKVAEGDQSIDVLQEYLKAQLVYHLRFTRSQRPMSSVSGHRNVNASRWCVTS